MPIVELTLTRDRFTETSTTGTLLYNGLPFGFVLEDPDRGLDSADPLSLARKVKRETCIPVGRYRVVWAMSPSRRAWTPRLVYVPAFQGVLLHPGSFPKDTEGCLLPGLARGADMVRKSRLACNWLYPRLRDADEAWITIGRDPVTWGAAPFNPRRVAV